ncbi:MAG TPA: glutaredoxin family protein [Holophaga sp.]|jgi:glutaredoxin|nr:glutaredoxin family protein [Holophaga sp.]
MSIAQSFQGIELQVYTATWCPDCRRLDRWLREQEIPFLRVDIESSPEAAAKLERETGKRAIPFLLVNGTRWVRGYHRELPSRFDPALLVREVLDAAGN